MPVTPFAKSYDYEDGHWSTDPQGHKFPWSDCVPGKSTFSIVPVHDVSFSKRRQAKRNAIVLMTSQGLRLIPGHVLRMVSSTFTDVSFAVPHRQ